MPLSLTRIGARRPISKHSFPTREAERQLPSEARGWRAERERAAVEEGRVRLNMQGASLFFPILVHLFIKRQYSWEFLQ